MRHHSLRRRRYRRQRDLLFSRSQPGSCNRALRVELLEDRRMLSVASGLETDLDGTGDAYVTHSSGVGSPAPPPSVTIINHGWQLFGGDGSPPPDWMLEMGISILERAGGTGNIFVHDTDSGEATFGGWIPLSDLGDIDYTWTNSNNPSHELVLIYNWVWDSNDTEDGWLQAAADNLFASLLDAPLGIGMNTLNAPLHFIGHSRGAVVNSLTTNLLGHYFDSFTVDQVTTLDPHPILAAGTPYEANDPEIFTYENVRYADNYFQQDGSYQGLIFDGKSVPSARNIELINAVLYGTPEQYLDGGWQGLTTGGEHSDTHLWYSATVSANKITVETLALTEEEAAGWWTAGTGYAAAQEPASGRANVGYSRTRVGDLDRSNFEVTDGFTITPPSHNIYNGDFSYGDYLFNEIPGWERHGGTVDADLTADGRLYLGEYSFIFDYESITHNPLYFPENVIGLSFDYEITDDSLDDQLAVYVGSVPVGIIPLDTIRSRSENFPLDSSYQGIVDTITFELISGSSITSDVYIDNVDLDLAALISNANFDIDGDIDGSDFLAWQRGYSTVFGASLADGDANGDHDVDGEDLTVWHNQFGTGSAALDAATSPAIEPSAGNSLLTVAQSMSPSHRRNSCSPIPYVDCGDGSLAAQPSMKSKISTSTTEPLAARLVDAAITMDQALRSGPGTRLGAQELSMDENVDRSSRFMEWSQPLSWQERNEIASNSVRGQANMLNDGGFHSDADAVNEELLDELFAKVGLENLL
jgi:hypothetical protein